MTNEVLVGRETLGNFGPEDKKEERERGCERGRFERGLRETLEGDCAHSKTDKNRKDKSRLDNSVIGGTHTFPTTAHSANKTLERQPNAETAKAALLTLRR